MQCFLESLPCSHKEEWRSQARGGIGDEGGDRTKEGSGPLIKSLAEGQGLEGLHQLAWTRSTNGHYQPLCWPSDRRGRWHCGGQQGWPEQESNVQ